MSFSLENLKEATSLHCVNCGSSCDLHFIPTPYSDSQYLCKECLDSNIDELRNEEIEDRCQRDDDFKPTGRE